MSRTKATDADGLAIDLRDVAKVYKGRVHALQGIEMRVRRGEVFGLLGPNGAGKSTLVKIMMTVIRPTRADGTLLGHPVGHKPTLRRVGYLPENHRFPRYLTGRQTLDFFGALSDVDRATRKRRADELLATVGMSDWGGKRISTYSKGMLQRVGLAQALMAEPDLVVLDEPTDGVDPVGRRDIRDVLLRLRDAGKTVFINSHLLSELEMICDRVAILVKGQVALHGTIDELTRAQQRYDIEVADDGAAGGTRERVRAALAGVWTAGAAAGAPPPPPVPVRPVQSAAAPRGPTAAVDRGTLNNGAWVELDGPMLRIGTTDAAAVQPVIDALRQHGVVLRRVMPVRQSLEDLFLAAVTDPVTGQAMTPGASRNPGGAPPPLPPPRVPGPPATTRGERP